MKKIYHSSFLITLACAALFCSCQKDETVNLTAVFADKPNSNAKVYIEDNYGYWQNGDAVSICSNGAKNDYLLAVDNANPHIATIPNVEEGAPYTAGYPAANVSDLGSGTLKLTIPSEQTYAKAAPYSGHTEKQRIVCPMAAYSDDGSVLRFYNVGAVLAVNILNSTGNALNLYAIEVESDNAPLTGKAAVTVNADGATISGTTETSTMVTLSLSGVSFELGNGKDTCLYIPVLPISSEAKSKLTVHVKATNGDTKYTFHGISSAEDGVYINQGEMGSIPVTITTGTAAAFWGQGTAACPYLIESKDDLLRLRTETNAGTSKYCGNTVYYKQTVDIDLSDDAYSDWGSSTNYAIGNSSNPFSANYYGASHYVKLKVLSGEVENPIGIFGIVGGGGSISWLCSTGSIATIAKNKAYVGGITGLACGNFTFSHCVNEINYTTAAVSGSNYNNTNFGGICGRIDASSYIVTINDCRNKATLTKQDGCLGGICAYINAGSVSFNRDTNSGPINHNSSSTTEPFRCSGGILGYTKVDGTSFTSCINMGRITASANMVGGIVGSIYKGASFSSCINAAKISTNSFYAGGIMGYGAVNGETTATFVNCGNRDTISSTSTGVGGILGHAYNSTVKMSGCFSDENAYVEGTYDIGGLIGRIGKASTIKNCINRGDVKGSSTAIGGILGNGVAMITIEGCLNTGSVKSNSSSVGGIIGQVNQMKISLCRNDADSIKGLHTVGGIIGKVVSASGSETMDGCLNTGVVHATGASSGWMNVGGLIGWAGLYSMINSGNTGRISGTNLYAIAGLMGDVRYSPTIVKNCFNKSEIYTSYNNSAVKMAGLIYSNKCTIGNSTNPVLNCYFSGTLSCPHASATKVAFVLQNSSGYDVYYDYIYSPDGMGTTNGELKSGSYYSKDATIHARYHFNTNGSYATESNTNTYFSSGKNLTGALNEWVNSQGEESGYYSWVDSDGDGIPVLVFPWPDSWNSSPSKRQRAHK